MTGDARPKTAFVLAGGGSFGAIHVGMLHALARRGIVADMVVGSSVGALNGAYYAGNPTIEGIQQLETIWRGLRRSEVFPVSWRTIMGFLYRRDFLIPSDGLRQLVDQHLTYRNLEDAKVPVHIVATDILSGGTVVLSEGSAAQAIIASAAIPRSLRTRTFQRSLSCRWGCIEQHAGHCSGRAWCAAPDRPSFRLRLRPRQAAGRGGRKRAACVDPADRAATNDRIAGTRSQHRIFCGAAAMSAGRIAV